MDQSSTPKTVEILVINPNSSTTMTDGLKKLVEDLGYSQTTHITFFTAPTSPNSINNESDTNKSAEICAAALRAQDLSPYHAFIVACYSVHPLVDMLREFLPSSTPVVGIFEASISTSLSLLSMPRIVDGETRYSKCGIVTTGKYWEAALTSGVLDLLGAEDPQTGARTCKRFKGVESTGLSAAELHTADPAEVKSRMMAATRRLVKDGDVRVVCLGCAGMAGMDAVVRDACVQELGEVEGGRVRIVDGVKAAIAIADGLARA